MPEAELSPGRCAHSRTSLWPVTRKASLQFGPDGALHSSIGSRTTVGRPAVVGAALLSCLFIPGASEASHGQAVSESSVGAGFVQKETGHHSSVLGTGRPVGGMGFSE